MASTAKGSVLINLTNLKCGQKYGLAGKYQERELHDSNAVYVLLSWFLHSTTLFSRMFVNDILSTMLRYTKFGGPIPQRPAEDIAFSVARFVQNNGSFFNYYMVS